VIRSMTGFGEAARQVGADHYAVELRTLNNRYFKASLRLPDELMALEAELEVRLRHRIARGSVTLSVKLRQADANAACQVNTAALRVYLDQLADILNHGQDADKVPPADLSSLLQLPGVLIPRDEQLSLAERSRPIIIELLDEAFEGMTQMRQTEGQAIADDLVRHRQLIRDRLEVIAQRAPGVIDEYHQRLRGRIDELLAKAQLQVDKIELIREVAVFAERSDISEEIARLKGHLDQFEQIAASDGPDPVGRTLEFLSQEMLREANTISSKSNDGPISRAIVEVKGAIDRIREQTQNIE